MLPTSTHHFLRRHLAATPWYFRASFSISSFQCNWSEISTDNSSAIVLVVSLKTTFPYIWLRDASQSPECVHPSNSQRLSRTLISPSISNRSKMVSISPPMGFASSGQDGHESFYDRSFLKRHSSHEYLRFTRIYARSHGITVTFCRKAKIYSLPMNPCRNLGEYWLPLLRSSNTASFSSLTSQPKRLRMMNANCPRLRNCSVTFVSLGTAAYGTS